MQAVARPFYLLSRHSSASCRARPFLSPSTSSFFWPASASSTRSPRRTTRPVSTASSASSAMASASAAPVRPTLLRKPVRIACVQLASGPDKAANLAHARELVLKAAREHGAGIVVLPECFNSPYGCDYFPAYAEPLLPSPPPAAASPSFHALSAMAREAGVYLVGGSIPEVEEAAGGGDKKYYNTSLTFDRSGALLATHRKLHLFDIDIPGKIRFQESEVLSAGRHITTVDLPDYGRIAIGICYDVRFPEPAMVAARRDACFALVYPGAFNTTTGPLHWRLLAQARAVDNQLYVALCSPARDTTASYIAWGHSLVADPLAKVLVEADEAETIVTADLTADAIEDARSGIPLRDQRRFDVYPDVSAIKAPA